MIYKWELALQYYPNSKSKKAATDRLKYAIDHCRELKQLISLGPQNRKAFFPYQEKLILEYLGLQYLIPDQWSYQFASS